MPHRIPQLNAMAATLADLAVEATDMGELQLAKLLVDAMNEAKQRAMALRPDPMPAPELPTDPAQRNLD